jgi:hypothetical protein
LNGLFSARDEDPGVENASTTTPPREPPPTVAP